MSRGLPVWRQKFVRRRGLTRSNSFRRAAALLKFASMVNSFIPSLRPANGRTLTRSRSRLNQKSARRDRRARRQIVFVVFAHSQRRPLHISRRVKGAWWSLRSSKPLSVPHARDRGRFDSYPLRLSFVSYLTNGKEVIACRASKSASSRRSHP